MWTIDINKRNKISLDGGRWTVVDLLNFRTAAKFMKNLL